MQNNYTTLSNLLTQEFNGNTLIVPSETSAIEVQSHNRSWANPFNPEQTGTPKAVQKALDEYGSINLSLGVSEQQDKNWINMDIRNVKGVQVVHDLEKTPWPIPDECVELIMAPLIVEHIDPAKFGIFKFFDEAWRVLKVGKQLMVSVPYAGGPMHWGDPGHTIGFSVDTFLHFDPLHPSRRYYDYQPLPWKLDGNLCYIQAHGLIEIVLEKRMIDVSYGVRSYK